MTRWEEEESNIIVITILDLVEQNTLLHRVSLRVLVQTLSQLREAADTPSPSVAVRR